MNQWDLSHYISSTVMTLVILCLFSIPFAYAETIYVDLAATGPHDGTSWNDAHVDLQPAIEAAAPGDDIWVATGTYSPTTWPNGGNGDRERHFSLKNGVTVYGGFAGTETSLRERDVEINETILSGDIGIEGDDSDNCFHVFYHPEGTDLDSSAVLDGFSIAGGNADGSSPHIAGGGMYNDSSSPMLINCTFSGNSAYYSTVEYPMGKLFTVHYGDGGGMYNYFSSPTLANCTFSNNSAAHGGGMHNCDSSSPTLINCVFSMNSADYGGGMCNWSSSPSLSNCTFSGNSACAIAAYPYLSHFGRGGGMYNRSSSPILSNCTFSDNSSNHYGGGMFNWSSSPHLNNCVLWNNDADDSGNEVYNYEATPIFAYCDIEGSFRDGVWDGGLGKDEGNNVGSDPLFARNPGTNGEDDPGDLHLSAGSPCIDAGDPSLTDGQDMDGEVRVFDGDEDGMPIVDMGADEYIDSDYDGTADRDEPPGILTTPLSGNTGEDGTNASFSVRLNSPPNGDVILLVESNDDSEGTVSPRSLTFTSLSWKTDQTVTITGVDDNTLDGDQPYSIQVAVDINNAQDTSGYLDLDAVNISVTNSDDGNDAWGSSGGGGGSSGGCFINSLFDVEKSGWFKHGGMIKSNSPRHRS